MFIVTKIWRDDYQMDKIEPALKGSLERLGLEYVDLYLVHWTIPVFDYSGPIARPITASLEKMWPVFEDFVDRGLTKHIGVSNCTVSLMANLLANCRIPPAVNQIEMNPYLQQSDLLRFHHATGVAVTAYAPIGATNFTKKMSLLEDPVITSIAAKHGKSNAQIMLAWNLQRGVIVIPKSSSHKRLEENFKAQEIVLTEEDNEAIAMIDKGERNFDPLTFANGLGVFNREPMFL